LNPLVYLFAYILYYVFTYGLVGLGLSDYFGSYVWVFQNARNLEFYRINILPKFDLGHF